MENKLLRIFTIIFWLAVPTALIALLLNLIHLGLYGSKIFPFYYLAPVMLLPMLGYVLIRIGEYFDNRKIK